MQSMVFRPFPILSLVPAPLFWAAKVVMERPAVAGSQYIAVCDGDGVEGGHSVYAQTVDAGLDQKAAQVQHGLLKRRHRAVINGLFEKFPLDPHL